MHQAARLYSIEQSGKTVNYTLDNGILKVTVSDLGAEIFSVEKKRQGIYLERGPAILAASRADSVSCGREAAGWHIHVQWEEILTGNSRICQGYAMEGRTDAGGSDIYSDGYG